MAKVATILVNYKDYAQKYLPECIASLRRQQFNGQIKIFIVDNATSAESAAYLQQIAPEAELVLNKENDGFAKGNNDAMKLALSQGFDYIVLFNLDMIIDPQCVSEMVKASLADDKIGAVQARMMLCPEKKLINSLGNVTHFLGFGYSKGYKEKLTTYNLQLTTIAYPSGAAVLFKAEVLKKLGLFDEEFWMYSEDQDLGWRIWLAGYRCVLAPDAVAFHKYEFHRSAGKFYWLDRNRMLAIWKNYHWLTLLLILPAFLIMEIGLISFSFQSGWYKEKLKVWGYFLNPKNWPYLFRARRESQKLRQAKDADIIKLFSGRIWYQEIDDVKLRLINPIFHAYWAIVKLIVNW
jgi:GT2 family glycosyltransferase